ncbi:hypothetical protein [Streptomyces sp. NBC_01497]|uniref:hypothetical protein n=1 Tax=Streptomyces sp. NBC_01497 TaxID=2903885 RepID=UPI002E350715|nr:hypothetical protein [Streptomyces sp. NBC_01497]
MSDPTKPDDTDATSELTESEDEFEVEAHSAAPLGLQELGIKSPEPENPVVGVSLSSMILC